MKLARIAQLSWVRPNDGAGTSNKGVPVPFFFWLVFAGVALAELSGASVAGSLSLSLAAALMLIGGLPHGAFDIAIAQAALRLKWQIAALIFGAYVGVAGLMLGLWHISPISALALFLAFSAIHFGDDWDMLDNGLLRTMAGASVICVAAFFNPAAVSDLFLAMAGPGAEWIQRILVAIAPVAILVTIVGIWQAVKAGSRAWALAQICAFIGLACFPPQVGFLIYFVFLHSPLHMRGIEHRLPQWSQLELWLYGGVICASCFIGAYIFAPGFFSVDPMKMSSAAFQILSVVAAPHLLLSQFLDRRQSGERSMAVSGR